MKVWVGLREPRVADPSLLTHTLLGPRSKGREQHTPSLETALEPKRGHLIGTMAVETTKKAVKQEVSEEGGEHPTPLSFGQSLLWTERQKGAKYSVGSARRGEGLRMGTNRE